MDGIISRTRDGIIIRTMDGIRVGGLELGILFW